jgi:hypothetical protein
VTRSWKQALGLWLAAWTVPLSFAGEVVAAEPPPGGGATTDERPAPKRELGLVPFAGGDTDVGLGVGLLGNLAALDPERLPYKWRLEVGAFASSRFGAAGQSSWLTFQDYYAHFVVPDLFRTRLRLELRGSYTEESTLKYYGLGNASVAPARNVAERDFFGRRHPTLLARVRIHSPTRLFLQLGASYTHNWLEIEPGSTLATDLEAGTGPLDPGVSQIRHHGVLLMEGALVYDSRDDEIAPERGQYHTTSLRISPNLGAWAPYGYQQLGAIGRVYLPIVRARLSLAVRGVFDLLIGSPPFYELARFEETSAIGGLRGVRGVPAQRYYGKVKLFGNAEARLRLGDLGVGKRRFGIGLVAFFDGGRLWSELDPMRALDGRGIGLKYGVGGGVRVQQGRTFVVRADLAWSPDARPVGGYLAAGQMF